MNLGIEWTRLGRLGRVACISLALLVSLGLWLLLLWGYLLYWDRSGAATAGAGQVPVANWVLQTGEGEALDDGFQVSRLVGNELFLVMPLRKPLPAHDVTAVTVKASRLESPSSLEVAWMRADAPEEMFTAKVDESGRADLAAKSDWNGSIVAFGLRLTGFGARNALVSSVSFAAPEVGIGGLVGHAVAQLAVRFQIEHRMINAVFTPVPAPYLSVTLLLAGVVVSVVIVFLIFRLAVPGLPVVLPALMIALAGWLALDYRWQASLLEIHSQSVDRYWGKSSEQRILSSDDAPLYRWLTSNARTRIPDSTERVIIQSDSEYVRLRGAYYLAGLNVFGRYGVEVLSGVREGDILVIVFPWVSGEFEIDGDRLSFDAGGRIVSVPVAVIHQDSIGMVLRVGEEKPL